MPDIGARARAAARPLAIASAERKHAALVGMARRSGAARAEILDANAIDLGNGEEAGSAPPSWTG